MASSNSESASSSSLNFDDLFASDVRTLVLGAMDVRSLTALACVSRALCEVVCADAEVWRARAAELDLHETPEGVSFRECVLAGLSLRVGDCLEVVDTFNITSTARVLVILGPLLLIHFEGWEDIWYFWLHRVRDRARIGPLTPRLPGTGAAGAYDAAKYRTQLDKAQAFVAEGVAWFPPSGKLLALWPWPYSQGRGAGREHGLPFTAPIAAGWRDAQLEVPFVGQAAYAADPLRCERAYRAATFAPERVPLPGELPLRLSLMWLNEDGSVAMLPEEEEEAAEAEAAEAAAAEEEGEGEDVGSEFEFEADDADVAQAAQVAPAVGAGHVSGGEGSEEAPSVRAAFAAFLAAGAQLWGALVRSSQHSLRQMVGCAQPGSRRPA